MVKNIQIIQIQSMIMLRLHLVISKTKLLPLVHGHPKTQKLKYLISNQIHGRRNLPFLTAQHSEFIFGWHLFVTRFNFKLLSISHYGVISRKSSVLIIGGRCDGISSALVAKYAIDEWERVGNLQNSREYHRAIVNDNRFYVVGGAGTL